MNRIRTALTCTALTVALALLPQSASAATWSRTPDYQRWTALTAPGCACETSCYRLAIVVASKT